MTYVYNSQLDAFTIYHVAREDTIPISTIGPALPALGHATSGAVGTAISKLITYPLDLVITRLQVQKQFQTEDKDAEYANVLDAVEKIYRKEGGLKAFYSGVIPETLKGVADSFLFFLAYSYIRQKRLTAQSSKNLSVLDEIGVGVLAGAFSKFFTTPIQNIVTRKQAAAMIVARDPTSSISPDFSAKDIALQIRHEKGLQGFWSGYSASLILTLNPSATFLLHRTLLRLLVPMERRSDPGAKITFLLAAISKAMASTLTYPFSLAKTRAQVSSQKPSQVPGPTSETEKPSIALESQAVKVRQRTVFSTIIRIARTEGFLALYQGLGGEVLKGFFSHGITMLVKDRIHTVIINLYYLILQSLQRYPGPEELAHIASERAKDAYEQGKEQLGNAYDQSREQIEAAYSKGSEQVGEAYAKGKVQATEAYAKSVEVAGDVSINAQEAFKNGTEQASELLEKGKVVASDVSKQVQDTVSRNSGEGKE